MWIRSNQSTFAVHIKLSILLYLTYLDFIPFMVIDRNVIGLITTGPNYKICTLDIILTYCIIINLSQNDSLLLPIDNFLIKFLSIWSQPSKRKHISLLRKLILIKIVIAIFLCLFHILIENPDLFTVEDSDTTRVEKGEGSLQVFDVVGATEPFFVGRFTITEAVAWTF